MSQKSLVPRCQRLVCVVLLFAGGLTGALAGDLAGADEPLAPERASGEEGMLRQGREPAGPRFPLRRHLDQHRLPSIDPARVIGWGGLLFTTDFNRQDGVGANLSGDQAGTVRFTRIPRMDLPGFAGNPLRTTGPNAQSCRACHDVPMVGGAGALVDMEIRDSLRTGDPTRYVQRNPLALHGSGVLQLLAEQTTIELGSLREQALAQARSSGRPVTAEMVNGNGVSYGTLIASPDGTLDTSGLRGISPDLIVRPYTWKGGFVTFLRPLVSIGTEQEMGLQPVEFFGEGTDFDFDGVSNEMTLGDITAMTLYIASLPRPVTQLELHRHLGGEYRLPRSEIDSIRRGEALFADIGCAGCHRPESRLRDPIFREPSRLPQHRFPMLPSGQDPVAAGLDPARPVSVDLSRNPQIGRSRNDARCRHMSHHAGAAHGEHRRPADLCFLQLEIEGEGVIVRSYGDLKWHDMGPALAERIDEAGTGASMWKTRELWGVASTGPWLHDGRATGLDEAILWHGGEAEAARNAFAALGRTQQRDVLRFLDNLVLFDVEAYLQKSRRR